MNFSNISNNVIECSINRTKSLSHVFECYKHFFLESPATTLFEILLGISILVVNFSTFTLIYRKSDKKIIFDILFMSSTVGDFTTGLLDFPIYHLYFILDYWSFSELFCIVWRTIDSVSNTTTIFHMLFLSWVRAQSVLKPKTYLNNIVMRNPIKIICLIWIASYLLCIPVNYFYTSIDYNSGGCEIKYKSSYVEFIFAFILLFVPLLSIIILTLITTTVLKTKKGNLINSFKRTGHLSSNRTVKPRRSKKLKPEIKLLIIIVAFLIQWIPTCALWMLDSICNCVPGLIKKISYLLTFTESLVNPVLVLILNSRYK